MFNPQSQFCMTNAYPSKMVPRIQTLFSICFPRNAHLEPRLLLLTQKRISTNYVLHLLSLHKCWQLSHFIETWNGEHQLKIDPVFLRHGSFCREQLCPSTSLYIKRTDLLPWPNTAHLHHGLSALPFCGAYSLLFHKAVFNLRNLYYSLMPRGKWNPGNWAKMSPLKAYVV